MSRQSIVLLTDYKGFYQSRWKASPYRSGYDQELLKQRFADHGYDVEFIQFVDVDPSDPRWADQVVAYTSSEERGLHYKSYLEDVVYALELAGAKTVPPYRFLRALNNKVFMEMLRDQVLGESLGGMPRSLHFGALEDLENVERMPAEFLRLETITLEGTKPENS